MNNQQTYYNSLRKPSFAPPASVFGPVWSVLYIIIAISFGTVVYSTIKGFVPWTIELPFLINIVFNAIYTPLQFRLRSNVLASIDILLVLGTLVWALIGIHSFIPWVTYINILYLLWVGFATVLQLTITKMNWK